MLRWYPDRPLCQTGWGTTHNFSCFWEQTTFLGHLQERHDARETGRQCQAHNKCSRNKALSFQLSSFSLPFFSPLEGLSLEMITSENRSQLSILDILLIFVYVFKSHLDSGMIQGKDVIISLFWNKESGSLVSLEFFLRIRDYFWFKFKSPFLQKSIWKYIKQGFLMWSP